MFRYLFILAIVYNSIDHSFAQEQKVVLLPEMGDKVIDRNLIYFLKDTTNKLSIQQVRDCNHFTPLTSSISNFGFSSSPVWLKLIVRNDDEHEWNIVIENPTIDEVSIYYESSPKQSIKDLRFLREKASTAFVLRKGFQIIYLKVKSNDAIVLPISITSSRHLYRFRHRMNIWQGIFYGVILSLLIYNSVVFVSLRNKATFYYILYVVCFALTSSYATGYYTQLNFPFAKIFDSYPVVAGLTTIFGLLFFKAFFPQSRKLTTIYPSVLYMLIVLFTLSLITDFVGFKLYANVATHILVAFTSLYVLLYTTVFVIYNRFRPAYYLLVGWLILLSSIVVYILASFSLLPFNIYVQYLPQVGGIIDSMFIACALADNVYLIRKSKRDTELREQELLRKHNNLIAEHNKLLEHSVSIRTNELLKANKVKDKFFSIVAHDLRNPLNSLAGFISLFKSQLGEVISREDLILISAKLKASVLNTIDLTENLLTWAHSQMEGDKLNPRLIKLENVLIDTLNEIGDQAKSKNIHYSILELKSSTVFVDYNQLKFVLRNLVTNAIKFTKEGGKIFVEVLQDTENAIVLIRDTGIGMSDQQLIGLFDLDRRRNLPGTNGEKGTGLGLILCKEFLERNNGSLVVVSKLGLGSEFRVILPLIKEGMSINIISEQLANA